MLILLSYSTCYPYRVSTAMRNLDFNHRRSRLLARPFTSGLYVSRSMCPMRFRYGNRPDGPTMRLLRLSITIETTEFTPVAAPNLYVTIRRAESAKIAKRAGIDGKDEKKRGKERRVGKTESSITLARLPAWTMASPRDQS